MTPGLKRRSDLKGLAIMELPRGIVDGVLAVLETA